MSDHERNERAEFIKRAEEIAEEQADKLAADMLAAKLESPAALDTLNATIDALGLLGFKGARAARVRSVGTDRSTSIGKATPGHEEV